MPSPTYSQNKASIYRYREKNIEKFREYDKNRKRQYYAYQSQVKQLLCILNNFFENWTLLNLWDITFMISHNLKWFRNIIIYKDNKEMATNNQFIQSLLSKKFSFLNV